MLYADRRSRGKHQLLAAIAPLETIHEQTQHLEFAVGSSGWMRRRGAGLGLCGSSEHRPDRMAVQPE